MAKKINKDNGKGTPKAEFKGFVNYELTTEQKGEMREWLRNVEEVTVELDELLASLYKVTVMKSVATGGYQATAFCTDVKSPNAGYILSAFAPHWYDAMGCLAYKHAICLEGVWPIGDEGTSDVWG